MKVKVHYSVWKRVRYNLKLERLEDTKSPGGSTLRNYIKILDTPMMYPRIHFVTRELPKQQRFIIINYHVDVAAHKGDIYHPALDKVKNIFANS